VRKQQVNFVDNDDVSELDLVDQQVGDVALSILMKEHPITNNNKTQPAKAAE